MNSVGSGGSRISRWGAPSCWGGTNLRRGYFSAKMYAKMKELDPVGGGSRQWRPLDLPMVGIKLHNFWFNNSTAAKLINLNEDALVLQKSYYGFY